MGNNVKLVFAGHVNRRFVLLIENVARHSDILTVIVVVYKYKLDGEILSFSPQKRISFSDTQIALE